MKIIKGDLIKAFEKGDIDILIHGCNCFCAMGAGIAKQISKNYPEALLADKRTKKGDLTKLGNFSSESFDGKLIINAYTQFNYGRGKQVDYQAVRNVFRLIKSLYGNKQYRFGIPMIGAGLAGGDWNTIRDIIESEIYDENITLYVL